MDEYHVVSVHFNSMKQLYLSVFLLLHSIPIVSGAINRNESHPRQAFGVGNTSSNFITPNKKIRFQIVRKYKIGFAATEHEQNEILRLTSLITKKEHSRRAHSFAKHLVNQNERVLKTNKFQHREPAKRAINVHTGSAESGTRQASNIEELDRTKRLNNVDLQSSLETAIKDTNLQNEAVNNSYVKDSTADFPLISYQGTSNDSNLVRIEYMTDKDENAKQDKDAYQSVKERDSFAKNTTQPQHVAPIGDLGTSLEDLIRASNDSEDIRKIVSALLKDRMFYQNDGEDSLTSSNENKIKESAGGSKANSLSGKTSVDDESNQNRNSEANSNQTTKAPFATKNRSPDKTNEIRLIHAENVRDRQEKRKNKSGDTLYPSAATSTHAFDYETADHKGFKHLSSHQVLLEYFRKEHDLRHNSRGQTVKSQQEQETSDDDNQTTLSQGQNLNLNKPTAFTSATTAEISSSLNKTTKIGTDLAAVNESFFPVLAIELQNNINSTENPHSSDGTPATIYGSIDNEIEGIEGTNITIGDSSATLASNNNNNKSINAALANNMQQTNASATEFHKITRPEVGNLANPLNTSNSMQETLQHETNFVLPDFNSSFPFSLYSKLKQKVMTDTKPLQEENAEARNARQPIRAASLTDTHNKRLGALQQLDNKLSVNFFESWIYHYRSLDGLGLTAFMLKSGVSHHGSTRRLQRVIEKALSGKDVNLLIVGGSISAGGGVWKDRGNIDGIYDRALTDWWKRIVFPLTNSKLLVNEVTIGGTDSEYFSYCVKNYIKTMPDVVLWELAANDYKRYVNRSFDPATPLERLTRLLLSLSSHPALVFVNFFRGDYYGTTVQQDCPDSEDEGEQKISVHYNITSLSWRSMICSDIGTRRGGVPLTLATLFSSDGYHPSLLGHAQMASLLITYLRNVIQNVISKERSSLLSVSVSTKSNHGKKSSDIPEPLYTDQTSSDPRCWTLLTPNYNSPIGNTLDGLTFIKAENFEFINITYWPIRLDRLRCLRAQQPGAMVVLQFFVPSQAKKASGSNDISLGGREIAITTHNSFGGSAEVWFDQNYGERLIVVEPKPGQRRTQVSIVKRHAKAGMHTLTMKAIEKGFCLSAVMVQ